MPFQIVELPIGSDGEPTGRKVTAPPFQERDEAVARVESAVSKWAKSGYAKEQGYWWARDTKGNLSKFVVEGI